MIAPALLLGLVAAPSGVLVLHVDLQGVVERLPEAQTLAQRISAERSRLQADLQKAEAAYRQRPPVGAAREEALAALEQQRKDAEAQLTTMEQEGLAPILKKLRARLPADTYGLDQLPILRPDPRCDRTTGLSAAEAGPKPGPASAPACRYTRWLVVDFDQALRDSQVAQRTTKSLDVLRDQRQRALEEELRRLRLSGKGEVVLAEAYGAEQANLQRKETEAEQALEAKLLEVLLGLEGPGVLVTEKPEGVKLTLAPCDVTTWATSHLDGQDTPLPACAR